MLPFRANENRFDLRYHNSGFLALFSHAYFMYARVKRKACRREYCASVPKAYA